MSRRAPWGPASIIRRCRRGRLCRRVDESGALTWAPVGDWIKYYEYRDPGEQQGTRYVPHPRTVAPAPDDRDAGREAAAELQEEDLAPAPPPGRAVRSQTEPSFGPGAVAEDTHLERSERETKAGQTAGRARPRRLDGDPVGSLFPDAMWIQ